MEDFQDLCPSLVLSPGQWNPQDEDEDQDQVKTVKVQEPEPVGKEEFCDPVTSSLGVCKWDGVSEVEKGLSQEETLYGILTEVGFSWMQSGGTVPVLIDDDGAKVSCGSNEAKVKLKEKVVASKTETKKKKSGVAKVTTDLYLVTIEIHLVIIEIHPVTMEITP